MPRRGENIRKRADGRWEGRYTTLTEEGQKMSHSVYAKTYTAVKEKLIIAKDSAKKNQLLMVVEAADKTAQDSFESIALEWLKQIKSKRKPSTYVKYRNLYLKYLTELDKIPVNELECKRIKEGLSFLNMQESENLKKSVYAVLNQIIKNANKVRGYHIPSCEWETEKEKSKPVEVFNQTEQAALLRILYRGTDNFKAGILLCLSTGLRLGEVCALKWSDVDLDIYLLHVNSTVQRIAADGGETKTILWEGAPKSEYSIREIPLSEEMVFLLQSMKSSGDYIISGKKATEPRTYQYKLKEYLKEAHIAEKNFHALRHTFATNCICSGMDVKSLSEILGHANVQITLNKYVHPSIDLKRQYMSSLSSIYGQFLGQCS